MWSCTSQFQTWAGKWISLFWLYLILMYNLFSTIQVLLDDVNISEQMCDLTFYMIIILSNSRQVKLILPLHYFTRSFILIVPIWHIFWLNQESLLHSALLACSLYLLPVFATSQWNDLALVLLAHPQVTWDVILNIYFFKLRVSK